jgi:tRNA pseudouridine55 synthase
VSEDAPSAPRDRGEGRIEPLIDPDTQLRDGVAIIDKPAEWTSHDVVAKCRGILRNKKIGHSGTLDPDATGVLVLGVGRVTRLLRFLTALPKTYVGEVVLGVETSTLDASGEVTATHDMSGVTLDEVRAAVVALTGDILQIPPMVSAVKVDGKRLHELARAGKEVEREPRPVTVHRFVVDAVDGEPGVLRVEVDCSSGTYIRTLADDLGHALGGGAHLRALRRTAIGSFLVQDATSLAGAVVLPAREALRDYPAVVVRGDILAAVRNGKVLTLDELGVPDLVLPPARSSIAGPPPGDTVTGPWAVLDETGDLLAVYEPHRKASVKPAVVLSPAAT